MAEPAWRGWTAEFGPFLTLGIQLAVAVVAFFFLGRWLDGALGTAPWLMIGGLFIGIVGGLAQFLRTASALGKKEDEEARKERASRDH
jgi:F0F1-type ATP synthase assembly protein I